MATTHSITDVQRYWDDRPCNIRHSDQPLGTRAYFDEVEAKKFRAEPHIPGFCEFDRWAGKRVLEIGCGIGTMAVNFARAGADYTGVELSGESLKLANQRFQVYDLPGQFYLGNAEELDKFLPLDTYDLVFTWGVIHHSPRPDLILQQAAQYMRSGSMLKVMVYAEHSWKNYLIETGLDQPEAQSGCPIAYTYTPQALEQMIGPAFKIHAMEQDHIFPFQVEPYRQGQFIKQPWFDCMPELMFRQLERKLGWHLMATAEYL